MTISKHYLNNPQPCCIFLTAPMSLTSHSYLEIMDLAPTIFGSYVTYPQVGDNTGLATPTKVKM